MTASRTEQVRQANKDPNEFVLHRGVPARTTPCTEQVRHMNANTEEFVLHRGAPVRAVKAGCLQNLEELFPQSTEKISVRTRAADTRVTQFLFRHKLKHLSEKFLAVKWEDLPEFHLSGKEEEEFQRAWSEEKEDLDQLDELINTDIALFTGQKTGNTPDLKKFALQQDVDEIIVTFPKASYIPGNLKCPITKKLMHDPTVFSLDGRTYERSAITQHIQVHYSPLEAQQLVQNLHCNKYIREEILTRFES